ncbi:MAG TPA: peptidylprolyl isomerase [Bacteroidales bacterium]|nr:peptidylprolyl isomerase [Bacteroidales bacterium]
MKKYFIIISIITIMPFIACNKGKQANKEINAQNNVQQPLIKQQEEKVKKILITTKFGEIKIKLYNETPKHRDNMIKLVSEKFYDGTLFHRVIKNFMIQGGDPDSKNAPAGKLLGNGGTGYTIPAEFNSKFFHKKGALAAARMGDNVNPTKASSGSQFYIVQGQIFTKDQLLSMEMSLGKKFTPQQIEAYTTIGGAPHLDGEYTVFGEVYEGLDIIDKIASVKTDKYDRPIEDISMTIKIIE